VNSKLRILAGLLTLSLFFSCGGAKKNNKAKLVMIIRDGKARVISTSEMNPHPLEAMLDPWQPGAVALFRTSETTPNGEMGKAGEAYVIDENKKLRKIGEFDTRKSDDALKESYTYY
jgi:hypothetical protein